MTVDQENLLREVRDAVCGNKNTDTPGLISRVKELEEYKEKDKQRWYKISGGLIIALPVGALLAEWAKHKIFDL